jgi:hypothetical protein
LDRVQRTALVDAAVLLAFINDVHADWVDGQAASFVIGQPDFTATGGDATQNRLGARPTGVAVDFRRNKIYVADTENNRVLRYNYPFIANQPNADTVLGQSTPFSAVAGDSQSEMTSAVGLAVNERGDTLLVSDNNGLVLVFGQGLPSTPVAIDATDRSSSAFTANCNPSDGADSYLLDVSTRSDFTSFVSEYQHRPVAGTSECVTGLSSSRTYYFRIRAANAAGASDYSNRISVNTNGVTFSTSYFLQTVPDLLADP